MAEWLKQAAATRLCVGSIPTSRSMDEIEDAIDSVLGCGPSDFFWEQVADGQYLEWKIEGDDLLSFFVGINILIHHIDPEKSYKYRGLGL